MYPSVTILRGGHPGEGVLPATATATATVGILMAPKASLLAAEKNTCTGRKN